MGASVVICPKCKVRLKVPEGRPSPGGRRFRCPRCRTLFLVKRPVKRAEGINRNLVLVAHPDGALLERAAEVLRSGGYGVITARDGVEAMTVVIRELPFAVVMDAALPMISGVNVCKRLKEKAGTREIKVILVAGEEGDYASACGADDVLGDLSEVEGLPGKLKALLEGVPPPQPAAGPSVDADVERARRFVRAVLSDILYYDTERVKASIREGTFRETFSPQLSEGLKLYKIRIPQDVRDRGDFFNEEIERFLKEKKRELDG